MITGMNPRPEKLRNVEDRDLEITWDDGAVATVSFRTLRCECPCASCINELTGERTLDPATIPADIRPASVSMVGQYGIRFAWSDGHDTGIYTFRRLKEISDAPRTGAQEKKS